MSDRYAPFSALSISGPDDDGVLEIVIDTPGRLNSVDAPKHLALADVWKAVDTDPDTRVAVIRGANGTFSAGGDLDMIQTIMDDFEVRQNALREARDIVYNMINCSKIIVSAIEGVAVGAGLAAALMADILDRRTQRPHPRRAHQARCGGRRPRCDRVANPVRDGQVEVLPADVRRHERRRS